MHSDHQLNGDVEVAFRAEARLGEGPTWDAATGRMVWVDILSAEVHFLDPGSGSGTVLATGQHVGAARPRAGGGLVVNLRDGVGLYDTAGAFRWLLREPVPGRRGNEAVVDPRGFLWAGTMRYDEATGGGTLTRVAPDGTPARVLDAVSVSNGTGWSPDGRLMYYVDSPTRRVDVFDVDQDTGLVSGRRPWVEVEPAAGSPDGLTVDADGCVWVALWGGAAVRRYAPDGRLDRTVPVPVPQPTAVVFGGPDLADLYVTTARAGLSPAQLAAHPLSGSVLAVPGAGSGLPGTAFAG